MTKPGNKRPFFIGYMDRVGFEGLSGQVGVVYPTIDALNEDFPLARTDPVTVKVTIAPKHANRETLNAYMRDYMRERYKRQREKL